MIAACGNDSDSRASVDKNVDDVNEPAYEFTSFIIDDDSQLGLDGISYINRQNLRVTEDGIMLTESDIYGDSDLDEDEGADV